MNVSARTLAILAAFVWYAGGIVLLIKGASLLVEAETLNQGQVWIWLSPVLALVFGGLKAAFLFGHSCRKNLERISRLEHPKLWQFFRPGFFVALVVMILAGATLSRLAHNSYPLLIGVATLDLSLAVGLLASSSVYWKRRAFVKQHGASGPAAGS